MLNHFTTFPVTSVQIKTSLPSSANTDLFVTANSNWFLAHLASYLM